MLVVNTCLPVGRANSKSLSTGVVQWQNSGLQTSNIMNKIGNYFRDSYKELMEKVSWPTWTQLQQSTMIVLVATLVITALVSLMDFAAGGVLKQIYKMLD
jgi:preprotein translocase subunit SecE